MVQGVPGIWQRRSDVEPRLVSVRFVLENVITGTLIYQKQFSQHNCLFSIQIMSVFTINCMFNPRGHHQAKFVKFKFFTESMWWHSCLKHCITSEKVPGLISVGSLGFFINLILLAAL
jgi:hypothetical protein